MTSRGELYDLFVPHRIAAEEVGQLEMEALVRRIGDLRAADPDNWNMSNEAVAWALADELVRRHRYPTAGPKKGIIGANVP